jgi:hypothetical protein
MSQPFDFLLDDDSRDFFQKVIVSYWEKKIIGIGKITEVMTRDLPRDWYVEREPSNT